MSMRKGADDLEGLITGDQIFALENAAQEVDLSGGPEERLARVRLWTLEPMRVDSRRRMAGGELRLGTDSTYMGQ